MIATEKFMKFMKFHEKFMKFMKFHENLVNFMKFHEFHEISTKITYKCWNLKNKENVKFRELTIIDRLWIPENVKFREIHVSGF